MSNPKHLPFDFCRCNGETASGKACKDRDECRRYLSRDYTNGSTPFFMPEFEPGEECKEFWPTWVEVVE